MRAQSSRIAIARLRLGKNTLGNRECGMGNGGWGIEGCRYE